jgi:hypothetical protein
MRPARRIKQAEEVSRKLKALLSSSVLSQLLQHTPPAALTAEQDAQLSRCSNLISQLAEAFDEEPTHKIQLMDAMLTQQVACSIGSLITWVQQPEQQWLGMRAVAVAGHQGSAPGPFAAGTTAASICAGGVHLFGHFAAAAFLHTLDSAGACNLAARLTQQLDQSGKACRRNCKRLIDDTRLIMHAV